ncbi:MAG: efflux RND transporter periplasmic adaptor subunit [Methylomicrobium sp.]
MKSLSILLLTISLILTGCDSPTETAPRIESYPVTYPIVKDVTYSREYVGDIQSVNYVEMRSRVKGYLEKIHVDEGQNVRERQLLFTLDTSEFEKELQKTNAAYKNAIADLKAAEVELANVKLLAEKNIVSSSELDVMKAKINALKADVEQALANKERADLYLSFTKIKAPFDGVINRIPNKVGSFIDEGDMLTSISDNREVFVYFNLSETEYLDYITRKENRNRGVQLKLANHALYEYEGKIEMIESEFNPSTGNIAFRARFPNPKSLLKHGASGEIVINKVLKQALLIPQKSTFDIQDKLYVFVVDQNNVVHQTHIVPKLRIDHFYVVESGLAPHQTIVYEGIENMRDGQVITPIFSTSEQTTISDNKQTP